MGREEKDLYPLQSGVLSNGIWISELCDRMDTRLILVDAYSTKVSTNAGMEAMDFSVSVLGVCSFWVTQYACIR